MQHQAVAGEPYSTTRKDVQGRTDGNLFSFLEPNAMLLSCAGIMSFISLRNKVAFLANAGTKTHPQAACPATLTYSKPV